MADATAPGEATAAATGAAIRRLHRLGAADIEALAELLVDAVAGGASVSFMHPLPMDRARAFWHGVDEALARSERALLVAGDGERIDGTVQLVLAQPDNQPHRADLSKLLVHRRARRRGLGEALMRAAEDVARDAGKTLLVLDTATPEAARLYTRLGWVECGTIPDFALLPLGGLSATTLFYRRVAPA